MDTNQAAPYVFLSYASADRERALHVADLLAASGIPVWIDRKSIAGGTSWSAEIVEGIKACAVLVVLISPAAVASPNVQQELQLAWEDRRPLLPLVLAASQLPSAIQYILVGRQWIDVLDHPDDEWLPRALGAFQRLGLVGLPARPSELGTVAVEPGSLDQFDRPPSVAAPGLPRHNLPEELTSFVGRETDLADVRQLVTANRLVTLTGSGGSGKTRLALRVASELVGNFPDGVFYVPLALVVQSEQVIPAIAQAVAVQTSGSHSLLAALKTALAQRCLLLLVDNFEHVLAAAPALTELLQACPRVHVLVTSRAALRISGEHEFPVAPLPSPVDNPGPAELNGWASCRLFRERAQAVKSDFAFSLENASVIAEICRRLDGLPLAIELAAARVRVLSPPALLARLGRRLSVLTTGAQDLPARQRTLRNTIAWSYDLLEPPEQALFRRLGVFVGGCTFELAEEVCADERLGLDLLDGLDSLAGKSLLRSETVGGEERFAMLETVREYAQEQLTQAGEIEEFRGRHARSFLGLVEQTDTQIRGPGQLAWGARLAREYGNLQAALTWSTGGAPGTEQVQIAARLVGVLGAWWIVTGRGADGQRWTEAALVATGIERSIESLTMGTGRLIYAAAQSALNRGDVAEAARFARMIFKKSDLTDDPYRAVQCVWCLCLGAVIKGDFPAMADYMADLHSITEQDQDRWAKGLAIFFEGALARIQGDEDRAIERSEASSRLFREVGDPFTLAMSLQAQASIRLRRGDVAPAAKLFAEALHLGQPFGGTFTIANTLAGLAGVASARHDGLRAARLSGVVDQLLAQMGSDLQPADRQDYDRYVAASRALLGDTAYTAAWEDGRAMRLEQAVAYAVEENGR